jgi:hypothetical protein
MKNLMLISGFCCAAILATPALADEVKYEAVWHQGGGASLTTAPLSRTAFVETGEALVRQGLRLIDVETGVRNGGRIYVGLFTQGTGSNIFNGPIKLSELEDEMELRRTQGMRLLDFEVFRLASGEPRYLGVWAPGQGEELLTEPLEFSAFASLGETLTRRGLRLIDVEVENLDRRLLYTGLFRKGTGSNFITSPLSKVDFGVKRDQMVAQGLELVDVERVEVDGDQRFVGVWSTGPGESRLSQLRDFPTFFAFSQSQFNMGKRNDDVEIFIKKTEPAGCDEDPGPGPGPGGPNPTDPGEIPDPPSPAVPSYIELVGGNIFRIDWSVIIDDMPRIQIPVDYLPDFLPVVDGEIVLPTEGVCGFNLIKASSAFWQVPGDPDFEQQPFIALPDVQDAEEFSYLDGIKLWGPIFGCEGTNQQWNFPFPLTTQGPFNPQNVQNLSLVIQLDPPTSNPDSSPRIEFIQPSPDGETVDAWEMWDEDWMDELLEMTALLEEIAALNGEYCGISTLIAEICLQQPDLCPAENPEGDC